MCGSEARQPNRVREERRFPGGKGTHVALAVRELGEDATLLGFWGGGTGGWIRRSCEAKGVTCWGPDIDDWSRTCMTFKSEDAFDETELLGAGPTITDHDLGEQLAAALEHHPDVVHMNRREAGDFFKEKDVKKAVLLLARECKYAVMTSGAEGAYLAVEGAIHHAVCHVDHVYSVVGSGDCLLGGLAVGFQRGMFIADAARLGAACGAANCVREDLGMFYRKDVQRLVGEIRV